MDKKTKFVRTFNEHKKFKGSNDLNALNESNLLKEDENSKVKKLNEKIDYSKNKYLTESVAESIQNKITQAEKLNEDVNWDVDDLIAANNAIRKGEVGQFYFGTSIDEFEETTGKNEGRLSNEDTEKLKKGLSSIPSKYLDDFKNYLSNFFERAKNKIKSFIKKGYKKIMNENEKIQYLPKSYPGSGKGNASIEGVPDFGVVATREKIEVAHLTRKNKVKDFDVPIIFGPPGVGKTQVILQIAEENKWDVISADVSITPKEDLFGLPVPVAIDEDSFNERGELVRVPENMTGKGRTVNYPSGIMPFFVPMQGGGTTGKKGDMAKKDGIVFLDEFGNAPQSIFNLVNQILQQHRIGDNYMPQNYMIVCASNRPGDTKAVIDILQDYGPVVDRLLPINFIPNFDDFLKFVEDRENKFKEGEGSDVVIRPIIDFLDIFKDEVWNKIPKNRDRYAWTQSSREWMKLQNEIYWTLVKENEKGSNKYGKVDVSKFKSDEASEYFFELLKNDNFRDDVYNMTKHRVGPSAAYNLIQYLSIYRHFNEEDIKRIFNNPLSISEKELKQNVFFTDKSNDSESSIDNAALNLGNLFGFLSYVGKKLSDDPKEKLAQLRNVIRYALRFGNSEAATKMKSHFQSEHENFRFPASNIVAPSLNEEEKEIERMKMTAFTFEYRQGVRHSKKGNQLEFMKNIEKYISDNIDTMIQDYIDVHQYDGGDLDRLKSLIIENAGK